MQQEIGIKFATSFYESNQREETFKGIHVMKNDDSKTINHLDNASKPKDFEKWSTILKWDENVIEHKKIEGIVCEEWYAPSTQEMIQSLIPKMPNACSNNFWKMITQKPYKSLLKTKYFDL